MKPSLDRVRSALSDPDKPVEIISLAFGMSGLRAIAKLGVMLDGQPVEVWLFDPNKQPEIPNPGTRGHFWMVTVPVPPRGYMGVQTAVAARFTAVRNADD